jgi:hypothetical protein
MVNPYTVPDQSFTLVGVCVYAFNGIIPPPPCRRWPPEESGLQCTYDFRYYSWRSIRERACGFLQTVFGNKYLLKQRLKPRLHQHVHLFRRVRGNQDMCYECACLHAKCLVEEEIPFLCLPLSWSEAARRTVSVCQFRLRHIVS